VHASNHIEGLVVPYKGYIGVGMSALADFCVAAIRQEVSLESTMPQLPSVAFRIKSSRFDGAYRGTSRKEGRGMRRERIRAEGIICHRYIYIMPSML